MIFKTQPPKNIAIDFDGVIHDYKHPVEGRRMGGPIEGTKDALKKLKRKGFKIIIHTVRGDEPQHISDWMQFYGIPFDEITNIKPKAEFYIDDHGIHFENWEQALEEIKA